MVSGILAVCGLAFAAAVSAEKPTMDPFYTPPSNLASFNPGDIINSRLVPGPIGSLSSMASTNVSAAYQLLYRTQHAMGDAAATVATVLVPFNADFSKLVVYEAAYDSSDENCSPSYTLQQSSNNTQFDIVFISAALNEGWVVVTADYEGEDAAFVSGLQSGYGVLDSVRATLASGNITGVNSDAIYSLMGYSGGALGCEWALELQPTYAPELSFVGAAIGGLTPNITNVLHDVNKSFASYLAFAGINGLSFAYSNFSDFLNSVLIPSMADEFHSINFQCTNDTSAQSNLENKDIGSYLVGGLDALNAPIPQSVLKWGTTMGLRSTPKPPIFVYKAVGDEISPVEDTDALVAKYCDDGATIQYSRNTFGEHVTEAILGSGQAFGYILDRMNGVPAPSGCTVMNVTITSLDDSTFNGFSQELIGIAKEILGFPIGPKSLQGVDVESS